MGGKTKQSQRTKNNTRPSNSGRSAELLGATIPSFVGFTAHSDLGIVPLAPGFAISENLPDTFDASISTHYQLIFRKMSKKDPITKTKALQEFSELINNSDLDAIKTILPLWPKFYCNLANDVEHRVRETAQQAQSTIIDKAGKFIAPYLKQLAPVWIASQFDNYAPAASLALSTFRTSFAPHKVQEVFSFCQNEILEYISKNLLYHSPSTLNSAKVYTPEEAENKYSRIVVCSLKMFSLYLEKITKEKISEVDEKIKNIIQSSKFWSFAKNKDVNIKSAWFELLYTFLQIFSSFLETNKQQSIQIVFQNIDDTNPITTSAIWGCVLLIQTTYDDWYTFLNFKKAVQPKLFSLIKNNRNCATIFYPNLFPFITKLSNDAIQNSSIKEFYIDLFDKIKESIKNLNSSDNKSDITAIITALYECLRYIIQKESDQNEYDLIYYENLIQNYVLELIEWTIMNDTVSMKSIFLNVSTLIAYLSKNMDKSELYEKLLNKFWIELQKIFKKNSGINIGDNSTELNRCLELIQNLYTANTSHSSGKVKFSSPNDDDDDDNSCNREEEITTNQNLKQKSKNVIPNILVELRKIAVQLARTYVGKILNEKNIKLSSQLKRLVQMFGNIEFYLQITNKNDLISTFEIFTNFLCNEYEPCESMLDIVFDILFLLNKNDQMKYIEELLKISNSIIRQWIINRLLSYPLCIEPDIRKILSYDYVSEIIINFAKDFTKENSKEKFNLLHKCFFQIDSGEILINQKTIEGIVKIMSEPLIKYCNDNENDTSNSEILDTCGSFIAQIMPVICSNNVSVQLQNDIFLKLFKFSIEQITDNENLSEDTLWEIITCWQDALSSNNIKIDNELMNKCSDIIDKRLIMWNSIKDENDEMNTISIQDITSISDFTAKLIICSLESITDEIEHFKLLDNLINSLLGNKNSLKYHEICENLNTLCLHFELINGIYTNLCPKEYNVTDLSSIDIRNYFCKKFYNFMVIYKLICNIKSEEEKNLKRNLSSIDGINVNGISKNNDNNDNDEDDDEDDDEDREYTEDYIDPNEQILKNWSNSVYEYFISSMESSTLGESLMINSNLIYDETEILILNLTEKINLALKNLPELFIMSLKEKIFSSIKSDDISTIRTINLLKILNQYSKDDNGPILLFEDVTNTILDENNFEAYLNITQIMLKNIPSRSLPINYDILNENICITIRMGYLRCLITDVFSGDYNEITDKKIISYCLKLITEIDTRKTEDKTLLLYNVDISKEDVKKIYMVVELINLLNVILDKFPTQLDIKSWDIIRIGLSSWVLSVSKCIEKWYNSKVSIFISSVYKLFKILSKFIREEKIKSSTEELSNIIDEWENVFALEINLILFKSYMYLVTCENGEISLINRVSMLDTIASSIEYLDYGVIFKASQTTFKYKTDDIIKFCLNNLSNKIHSVRITCMFIIQKLTSYLVSIDIENLEKQTDVAEKANKDVNNLDNWHVIHKFVTFLEKYQINVEKYLTDFSYKLTDLPNFKPIDRDEALAYFYIWDCIIFICSKSPSELRSLYASTITENKFEQILLNFIFRSMPIEILKNHDSKVMSNEIFKKLNWEQLIDQNISIEKLSCYVYTQMLKYLPAVVRKWWNTTNARQKTFIDKLTTNFVSNLICNEELKAIAKHEKHENMQVTVHTSTREVIAIYSIDEARMELNITLASNHPLGAVKVENIKQIGSRAQSRNLGMQLTIFLTHQNGSIFDGLSIWKKNLDKKFEGVEECYVCYTVIHQDTCQLPKLSCRTCKKKFHGPCLYKWFTTSSKSTCPICRNVF